MRTSGGLLLLLLLLPHPVAGADAPPDDLPAIRRLLRDPAPSARAAAYRRLTGETSAEALALALGGLEDPHPYVRRAVGGVLGAVADPRLRQRLAQEAPRWRSETARREVCQAFSLWLDEVGLNALLTALGDRSPTVRAEAVRWLADDPLPRAREALRERVADPDPGVRAEALAALLPGGGTGSGGLPGGTAGAGDLDLTGALADADPRVRLAALELAVHQGGAGAVPALVAGLGDASWSVRLAAARLAPGVRDRRLLEPLVLALGDARLRVVEAAGHALVALTGIPFDARPEPWRTWLEGDGRTFDPALVAEPAAPRPPPLPPGSRTVETRFLGVPIRSRHVAFVLDGSGSMAALLPDGRTRWAEVVDALTQALGGLAGAHVNAAIFDESVSAALPRALPLDAARREALLRFVRARAPGGRTALFDGIAWGLADPEVDTLVVLSDGAPSAGQFFTKSDLLAEVRRANRFRRARIDVVAVGADGVARRWRDALERIAEESGGSYVAR